MQTINDVVNADGSVTRTITITQVFTASQYAALLADVQATIANNASLQTQAISMQTLSTQATAKANIKAN